MDHLFTGAIGRLWSLNRAFLVMTCLLLAAAACSTAQAAPALSAQQEADQAAILNYPLSMDVIGRLEKALEAGNAAHLPCMNNNGNGWRSLDAMAEELKTKAPGFLPILSRYSFTPKEFVTALMALANTEFAAAMLEHPDSSFAQAVRKSHKYNDKNVALFQAHSAQIAPVLKKIDADSTCGR